MRRKSRARNWVRSAGGELTQDVLLVSRRWQCNLGHNRQSDANTLVVPEEEQPISPNGSTDTYAKFVNCGTRLLRTTVRHIVRVQKVVLRVEQRAIPDFVRVAVERIGARFGEVVHLGYSVPTLIDGERVGIDRRFLDSVETGDEIRGKANVQSKPGIVRIVAIEDVAI